VEQSRAVAGFRPAPRPRLVPAVEDHVSGSDRRLGRVARLTPPARHRRGR
jgi:hypothetical protein